MGACPVGLQQILVLRLLIFVYDMIFVCLTEYLNIPLYFLHQLQAYKLIKENTAACSTDY